MHDFPRALKSLPQMLAAPARLGRQPLYCETIINRFCGDRVSFGIIDTGFAFGWQIRGCLVVNAATCVINQALIATGGTHRDGKQAKSVMLGSIALLKPVFEAQSAVAGSETACLSALLKPPPATTAGSSTAAGQPQATNDSLMRCLSALLFFRTVRSRRNCLHLPL